MLIQPLNTHHDRKGFDCGNQTLNEWFAKIAAQHKEKGVSSTFVAVEGESESIVHGFYAISMTELLVATVPEKFRKKFPSKVPAFRLGRLATAKQSQGKGIGAFMLFDAIDRATRVAEEIGGIGLVVNAKPASTGFYAQYGFEPMADHHENLILLF